MGRIWIYLGVIGILSLMLAGLGAKLSMTHPTQESSQIPQLNGDHWFNTRPLAPADLKGKVVLVDFWEYTCVNCLRTLPYIKAWYGRYHEKGLLIIGVHTPEFEFGKRADNVARAVHELGLKYPVVMDNEYRIWRSFRNQYWPRKYLFDAHGRLQYDHAGEGDYARTELEIQKLLHEIHPDEKFPNPLSGLTREDATGAVCYPMTPELYVGYWRGNLGNREGYQPGKIVDYRDPGNHLDGIIYAQGKWMNEEQAMRHVGGPREGAEDPGKGADPVRRPRQGAAEGYILIRYHAIEVNAVIKPEGAKDFRVYVFQDARPLPKEDSGEDIRFDEKGRSYLLIGEPRMYRIVYNRAYGTHELKLASTSTAFALYSYTFGACTVTK